MVSGVSYDVVHEAKHGRPVREATAKRISKATGGAVSVESLMTGDPVSFAAWKGRAA